MIAHIEGEVVEKINSSVIVDVSGIGYEVMLTSIDFESANMNDKIKLYTYHHIREQSQELFGFSNLLAKRLFEMLISVQGVGPKAAMAILSLDSVEVVRQAIASSDATYISRASGVGKKTAGRITLDLSDKVGHGSISSETTKIGSHDEALEALMALGYNLNDASKSLDGISNDLPVAERVKLALRSKI